MSHSNPINGEIIEEPEDAGADHDADHEVGDISDPVAEDK